MVYLVFFFVASLRMKQISFVACLDFAVVHWLFIIGLQVGRCCRGRDRDIKPICLLWTIGGPKQVPGSFESRQRNLR